MTAIKALLSYASEECMDITSVFVSSWMVHGLNTPGNEIRYFEDCQLKALLSTSWCSRQGETLRAPEPDAAYPWVWCCYAGWRTDGAKGLWPAFWCGDTLNTDTGKRQKVPECTSDERDCTVFERISAGISWRQPRPCDLSLLCGYTWHKTWTIRWLHPESPEEVCGKMPEWRNPNVKRYPFQHAKKDQSKEPVPRGMSSILYPADGWIWKYLNYFWVLHICNPRYVSKSPGADKSRRKKCGKN